MKLQWPVQFLDEEKMCKWGEDEERVGKNGTDATRMTCPWGAIEFFLNFILLTVSFSVTVAD